MARIRGGHTDPLASSEARPSVSAPWEISQASQAPTIPSSEADTQHPSGIAPEAIIKRPMVTAPPIEGNSDCRAREFFYPRATMDFYQSMTTQGAQSPTAIHFSIDGRQGILAARHIAEALHIPF
ncbi:hypothetical protein CK203_045638 [Vitis vinifera]|uniref:Uncharacterized protein n=1 Tax=Vitis vinifera TaxID=29760 RepID=A0A438HQ36_VITVI|nr:hypothetical protein CK203_045638 [Vitis vinifera]